MTEDQAKTKLCPMMLTNDRDTGHSLCEGSACMVWRSTPEIVEQGFGRVIKPAGGFCGLAHEQ